MTGLYRREGRADPARVEAAATTLAHRGPDERGAFTDGAFGMGHTRLSIIDLPGGRQPLYGADRRFVLITNGEIYNHVELRAELEGRGCRFATHSDSEVILHAYAVYGEACLERLHGMFAFALFDAEARRVFLARDRLGIKPLFLAHLPAGVAFASEIKALLPYFDGEPALDPDGLVQYLQSQFTTGATTPFREIERVAPAEAVVIESGRIARRWRYWWPPATTRHDLDFDTAGEEFDALMVTVMQQHMRSDVPFGLFLSGGVDSCVLLALLSHYRAEPIRTFSVGFEGTSVVDELPLARRAAERFGSRHTEIRPTPEDILHALPHVAWAADDLMRDNANLPTALLARAAGRELKVVFSGEGGDEVFAGYGRYRTSPLERRAKALLAPGSGGFRTRGALRGGWARRLLGERLRPHAGRWRQPFLEARRVAPAGYGELQRMQYIDLTTALPDNLLVKLDRMLMGASLEGRVPLLDHRVVAFGLSLPDRLKVADGQGKHFLKRWAEPMLPRELLYARKRGFNVPMSEFFRDDFRRRLAAVLPRHPAIREWFRPQGVDALLRRYGRNATVNRLIWALLQFAVWHELIVARRGLEPPGHRNPLDLIE